ncbi:hypothetical protein VTO42DRAFT_4202 [Malbranchea cinnamomea]
MQEDPFVISTDTKSKLDAFRYAGPPESAMPIAMADDADAAPNEPSGSIARATGDTIVHTKPENLQTQPSGAKNCPQTPAHRIPLADLISNTEDALIRAPGKTLTPDDHVYWDHGSSDPKGASPLPRRKKRARSSSPASSPLNPNSKHPPSNSDAQRKLMKTPQHDIAADLWTKYIGKSIGNSGDHVPKIHFSQLVSSPQTPAPSGRNSRDSIGLRRTNSCHVDWPISNSKRRRFDNESQARRIRNGFARSKSSILEPGKSKASKISMLVEKIQESIVKRSKEDYDGPSSSSPLPERSEHMQDYPTTPPGNADVNRRLETPSKSPTKGNRRSASQDAEISEVLASKLLSSDFGDDDLDNELLELAVETPHKGLPLVPQSVDRNPLVKDKENPGGDKQPDVNPIVVENLYKEEYHHGVQRPPSNDGKSDDFDDGEDDFADGVEEILAQYDNMSTIPAGQAIGPNGGQADLQSALLHLKHENANTPQEQAPGLDAEDDDEFADDEIDLEAIEQTMLQNIGFAAASSSTQNPKDSQPIKRYLILDLAENPYVNAKGRTQLEKVLLVQEEKTKRGCAITLRDSWFDTPCTKGSYIHLIGDFNNMGQCIVDNENNLIILHPDHLLSATVVADSFTCPRRAVLQDRVKVTSEASKPQVYGHILHEIFQGAMKRNQWDLATLNRIVQEILVKYVESLYDINVSMDEAKEYLRSKMPALKAWGETFLLVRPSRESLMEDKNGTKAQMCINKLLEVEEHIWSPMYGLKGNVDATVQVALNERSEQKTLTVPLEVKTGRNNATETHRAQTALYCLLLSDRYDIDVNFGILYYLEVSKTYRVRAIQGEIRQMVQQRNRLAGYALHRQDLPPMLKKPHICNQCYAKSTCFAYHKLVDDGDNDTSGMGNAFTDLVGHLTPNHQAFFKKWDALITMEEKDMMKFRRELWTMLSTEREEVGRCFSQVVIEPGSAYEDKDGPKINRFRYTFVKQHHDPGFSFTDSQITVGEPIVVSDEQGHYALSNGYVVQISKNRITVAVDRRLHNTRTRGKGFDATMNQTFTGIMEIVQDDSGRVSTLKPGIDENTTIYRLDKDEFSNGMATVRNNLLCVMDKDMFRARQLRELIIDGVAPSFKPSWVVPKLPASTLTALNMDQKRAVNKVMCANDYALVLGMPGTGKTTTIAQIIRAIVSQGKSVLLTSYTHTAVDNILLKIKDDNIRTLRIGAPAKVHPEVQQFADLAGVRKNTIEEIRDQYENSCVVATTCLGINHPIFHHRTFDYCIVDEASQITLPVCLGPIRMAKIFILVGDHYQLPPLVQSKEASEGGLDVSLFKLLCDKHPSSVVNLEHQYRMCEDIMLLSNTLIYSGRLKCGTPAVASRSLEIPDMDGLKHHHQNPLKTPSTGTTPCLGPTFGRCWIRDLLDPSVKVRLVNTDLLQPQAIEKANGSRIINTFEATLCVQLVESLISVGISVREIGVVTLYRSQLALLRQMLRHRLPELEMHTADRFQGRDKEVIIMSCVRSNSEHNVGDLLRDGRRVNVALTRARTKMLIVGSKTTLSQGNELLGKFVKLMEERGWCYDLPPRATEGHVFEEVDATAAATQKSPLGKKVVQLSWTSPEKKAKSPTKTRIPLSPVRNGTNGARKPQKVGGKLLDGRKIVAKRPVLSDVLHEMLG